MRQMLLATALSLAAAGTVQAAELALSVNGVRNGDGAVMIAVYDGAEGFRDIGRAVARVMLKARAGSVRVSLPGLPAATYAVAVFHDENGDGALDTNLLGIPTEGYGFSNDARGTMGPPSFEASAVTARDGSVAVPIRLSY